MRFSGNAASNLDRSSRGEVLYDASCMSKSACRLIEGSLTFLGFVSALPLLTMIGGTAAWNGINLAVALYILFGCAGALGLLIGAVGVFSGRIVFAWIADAGAVFIACIGLICLSGFLFSRDKSVASDSSIYIAGIKAPLVAVYCSSVLICGMVIWFSSRKICKARTSM